MENKIENKIEVLYVGCKIFSTRCREGGVVIDEFATLQQAKNALIQYEIEDKKDDTFTPDFYEICLADEPIND